MSTLSEATAMSLRAQNLVEQLEAQHVRALFALKAATPEDCEISEVTAAELSILGLIVAGRRKPTTLPLLNKTVRPCKLTDLGAIVVDALELLARHVRGVGHVKRGGRYLYAQDMRTVASCDADGQWSLAEGLGGTASLRVMDMFPELRWL